MMRDWGKKIRELSGRKAAVGCWGASGMASPELRAELGRQRVPAKQLTIFTRQLATLLTSGVQLVHALSAIEHQPDFPHFGSIIRDVGAQVGAGFRLSLAVSRYPKVFDKLFVTMVQVGESSGQLDSSLQRLADWLERDDALLQKIKASLTYPTLVLSLALGMTLLMFYTVLPGFVSIFEEMHTPLPLITRFIMLLTKLIRHPLSWVVAAAAVAAALSAWKKLQADSSQSARLFGLLLRVPGVGALLFQGTSARYCSALEVLLAAGLDLRRSLQLSAAASGNPLLEQDAPRLIQAVMGGISMATYMRANSPLYSDTLTQMTAAGEETSSLADMIQRAGYFHQIEMQSRIDAVSAALEPILLIGVALVVGTVLIAIFLPLYGMLDTLG